MGVYVSQRAICPQHPKRLLFSKKRKYYLPGKASNAGVNFGIRDESEFFKNELD